MKSRAELIKLGKIHQVYLGSAPYTILFEGSKSACMNYVKNTYGMRNYKNGLVRVGQLIWENGPKDYETLDK